MAEGQEQEDDLDPLGAPKTWSDGEDSGVPDPHYVEVLHESNETSRNILTNRSSAFLANLSRRFSARIEAILTFQGTPAAGQAPPENWKAGISEAMVGGRVVDLTGPAFGEEFLTGVKATRGTYTAILSDEWPEVMEGHRAIRQLLAGVQYYRTKGEPEPDVLEGEANVSLKLRPLHELDNNLILHRRPMACALRDFGLYAFFNGPDVQVRGENLDVTIRDVNNVEIAELWRDIFEYTEDALELAGGTLTATLEFSSLEGIGQAENIAFIARMFANGLTIDKSGLLDAGAKKKDYESAAKSISALCAKVGLSGIAPIYDGKISAEPTEKEVAAAVKEFEAQKALGFSASQVVNPALLKHGIQVFKHY